MKTNAELIQALALEAGNVHAANLALDKARVEGLLAQAAAAKIAQELAVRLLKGEVVEPEPVDPVDPVVPVVPPVPANSAPIKVQSAPDLWPLVIEDRIIDMGDATAGIAMASPDFWPPKGPKTDQDWNRALTVRRVTIRGGSPAGGKDWGMNVFACKALTLEDVHVSWMLKEHGVYDHNPAGPTVLRRCEFKGNGGQGYQQTRRLWQQPGDNYEGPFVVPDDQDTMLAEDCAFAGNGLDGSRAAWAGAFYAGRYEMLFRDCRFEALEDAPGVAANAKSGALCVAPERNNGETFPGMSYRTALTLDSCTIMARADIPRPVALLGSLRYLYVTDCTFAGTRVLIEDPKPDGTFTFHGCSGRVPIFVSRGWGQPLAQVGWTDEGLNMTGAEMLAKLPEVVA